jgi:hypothetical protein
VNAQGPGKAGGQWEQGSRRACVCGTGVGNPRWWWDSLSRLSLRLWPSCSIRAEAGMTCSCCGGRCLKYPFNMQAPSQNPAKSWGNPRVLSSSSSRAHAHARVYARTHAKPRRFCGEGLLNMSTELDLLCECKFSRHCTCTHAFACAQTSPAHECQTARAHTHTPITLQTCTQVQEEKSAENP